MEIKQLEYFVACAEKGSFRKASNILFTTQSNISKVIHSLEEELGGELFSRTPTGVELNERGRLVYEQANITLKSVERIQHISVQERREELRIMANKDRTLADIFCDYYKEKGDPRVLYSYQTGDTEEIIRSLLADEVQLAFVYIPVDKQETLEDTLHKNHLAFMELCKRELLLCLGNAYKIREDMPIRLIQEQNGEFAIHNALMDQNGVLPGCGELSVGVVTNCDYLSQKMLAETEVCSVRVNTETEKTVLSLPKEYEVSLGLLYRNDRKLTEGELKFLSYVRGKVSHASKEETV